MFECCPTLTGCYSFPPVVLKLRMGFKACSQSKEMSSKSMRRPISTRVRNVRIQTESLTQKSAQKILIRRIVRTSKIVSAICSK